MLCKVPCNSMDFQWTDRLFPLRTCRSYAYVFLHSFLGIDSDKEKRFKALDNELAAVEDLSFRIFFSGNHLNILV